MPLQIRTHTSVTISFHVCTYIRISLDVFAIDVVTIFIVIVPVAFLFFNAFNCSIILTLPFRLLHDELEISF